MAFYAGTSGIAPQDIKTSRRSRAVLKLPVSCHPDPSSDGEIAGHYTHNEAADDVWSLSWTKIDGR